MNFDSYDPENGGLKTYHREHGLSVKPLQEWHPK